MRVLSLVASNFKRIKLVRLTPTGPLTKIVGRNGQGKTSVLDSLAAALGGKSLSPDMPIRRGADHAEVIVDLGDIKVRRRWTAKSCTLEVVAADGSKVASPQAVLDALIGELSFDPLAFTRMKPREQAEMLAKIAGIDLAKYESERKAIYDERTITNRQHESAKAQLAGMPEVLAPAAEVSVTELANQLQEANEHNSTRQRGDNKLTELDAEHGRILDRMADLARQLAAERDKADANRAHHAECAEYLAGMAPPIDTSDIQAQIAAAESNNNNVRAAKQRADKAADVAKWQAKADAETAKLTALDEEFNAKVAAAEMPISGLTFTPTSVMVEGIPFAQCSGAEKLRTSVGIGFAQNKKLKLMKIEEGSLLDAESMQLLSDMAEAADAQVIIERVAHDGETGIIIEDGEVVDMAHAERDE